MKHLAALSLKQAVIAGVLVAGSVASLVLIAPGLFGNNGADDTDVAGTETTRLDASESASPIPSADVLDAPGGRSATASNSSGQPDDDDIATGDGLSDSTSLPVLNGNGSGTAGGNKSPGGGSKPPSGSTGGFEIKGDVAGVLYPTVPSDLVVRIENPYNFAIDVVTASVTVGNAGSCSARHLWIDGQQPSGAGLVTLPAGQIVPASGEITFTVPAQLENTAGDECQRASFPLTYSARAAKA